MHATIEQLLTIRDREPVTATIRQHAELCLLCRERLDALVLTQDELRRLPEQSPAQDYWPAIQAGSKDRLQAARRWQRLFHYGGLGLAASVLLAVILISNRPAENIVRTVNENITIQAPVQDVDQTDTVSEPDIETLIERSAYLESVLHALPQRPKVIRASTTDLITGLQDGVALIDYQLNLTDADRSTVTSRLLWQQRVDMMNSLVSVRYAEVQQVAYTPN